MIVYILSTYEEHGSENVKATADKDTLLDLIDSYLPLFTHRTSLSGEKERAVKVLSDEGTDADGYNLTEEWGGLMLHIIELC